MEDEEKYEENKMNFEGVHLKNSLTDLVQIWYERCPTQVMFHRKNELVNQQIRHKVFPHQSFPLYGIMYLKSR